MQGFALAKMAMGVKLVKQNHSGLSFNSDSASEDIEKRLKKMNITLPPAPMPVGNYKSYRISGKQVCINQIALVDGKVLHPGVIGAGISESQAKEATRQTMLNVLSVLKKAAGGDLNNVKQIVQMSGYFNAVTGYQNHAALMNEASDLAVEIFGEAGMHTRATFGMSSLPLNSTVEIQAIFELK